jgi:hypothetical protein
MEETELLKQLSPLGADISIRQARHAEKRTELRRARADVEIFDSAHPEQDRRKLSVELQGRRRELEGIVRFAAADLDALQLELDELAKQSENLKAQLSAVREQRAVLSAQMQQLAVAFVFDALCEERAGEARAWLNELRQLQRGDLMIGVLLVLLELFDVGKDESVSTAALRAKSMLEQLRGLFAEHNDPLPRVLAALIELRQGRQQGLGEIGTYQREQFSLAGGYNLYMLSCVLSGINLPSAENTAAGNLLQLIEAHAAHARQAAITDEELGALIGSAASDWPAAVVNHCLLAALLQNADRPADIIAACGIATEKSKPQGALERGLEFLRGPKQAERSALLLLPQLAAMPAPAWPAALLPIWQSSLACFILQAAQECLTHETWTAWLAESYGWPKHDLYWWTLSRLNGDQSLLRKLSAGEQELFRVNSRADGP